ncbi:hypothetical protein [Sorangium sp. So ce1000]|uniref:hypothetical protein n=1 Tax=Sorangium sp. So ce1000 TaxID=3133325 RepID=UPI003F5E41A3
MKAPITASAATPFRVRAEDAPSTSADDPRTDADLAAVFGLAWLACAITTLSAIAQGEAAGVGSALPALVVFLVPYLLRDWLRPQARLEARCFGTGADADAEAPPPQHEARRSYQAASAARKSVGSAGGAFDACASRQKRRFPEEADRANVRCVDPEQVAAWRA